MSARKSKKQVPKLENLALVSAVAIVVPLISSLILYYSLDAYSKAYPPQENAPQTKSAANVKTTADGKTNTANKSTPTSR